MGGFRNSVARLSELIGDVVTGALVRTAATGLRWEIGGDGLANLIAGHFDNGEDSPAMLRTIANGGRGMVQLVAPSWHDASGGEDPAYTAIELGSDGAINVRADDVFRVNGGGVVIGDFTNGGADLDVRGSVNVTGVLTVDNVIEALLQLALVVGAQGLYVQTDGVYLGAGSSGIRQIAFGRQEVTIPANARSGINSNIQHGLEGAPVITVCWAVGTAVDVFAKPANHGDSVFLALMAQRGTATSSALTVPVGYIVLR